MTRFSDAKTRTDVLKTAQTDLESDLSRKLFHRRFAAPPNTVNFVEGFHERYSISNSPQFLLFERVPSKSNGDVGVQSSRDLIVENDAI